MFDTLDPQVPSPANRTGTGGGGAIPSCTQVDPQSLTATNFPATLLLFQVRGGVGSPVEAVRQLGFVSTDAEKAGHSHQLPGWLNRFLCNTMMFIKQWYHLFHTKA